MARSLKLVMPAQAGIQDMLAMFFSSSYKKLTMSRLQKLFLHSAEDD